MIKKLLPILISVVLTAESITVLPVYAVEPGSAQEESFKDEDTQAEIISDNEESSAFKELSTDTVPDTETDEENPSDKELISEQDMEESESLNEVETEKETQAETIVEDVEEDPELLGEEKFYLRGTMRAADFTNKNKNIFSYLADNTTIILEDGDDIWISSLHYDQNLEGGYELVIKTAENSNGTGKVTIPNIDFDNNNGNENSLRIEGGIVSVNSSVAYGKKLTINGGELYSGGNVSGEEFEMTGGKLIASSNLSGNGTLNVSNNLTVTGGIVNVVSDVTTGLAGGTVTLSGGSVTAISMSNASEKYGARCVTLSVGGNAVFYAQGVNKAIYNIRGISMDDGHMIKVPTGGILKDYYGTFSQIVDSQGNEATAVKICPEDYEESLESDLSELDFGSVIVGYDENAFPSKTLTITNRSESPVTFIVPNSTKYDITVDEESLKDILPNDSAVFTIKPKPNMNKGLYNEMLLFMTTDGACIPVYMKAQSGWFLSGTVEASTLTQKYVTYELIGDTTINIDSNVTISNIDCKNYALTITGEDAGEMYVTSEITLSKNAKIPTSFVMQSGKLRCRSIYGTEKSELLISGGELKCIDRIRNSGKIRISGGRVVLEESTTTYTRLDAYGIEVTGGVVEVSNSSTKEKAIEVSYGGFLIENAELNVRTSSKYGIYSYSGDINIGAGSDIYVKSSQEAIVNNPAYKQYKIIMDPSLTIQAPKNGVIATSGTNSAHIVNSLGHTVKTVRIGTGDIISGLSASTDTLDFGKAPEGYTKAPAAKNVTITNNSNGPVSMAMPESDKYEIKTTSVLTNVASGKSVVFSVQPKVGIAQGAGSKTLTIGTVDGADSIDIELEFDVGYYLCGYVEAESLVRDEKYTIIDNTVLHIAPGTTSRVSFIRWEEGNPCKLTITGESESNGKEMGTLEVFSGIEAASSKGNELVIQGGNVITNTVASRGDVTVSGGSLTATIIYTLSGDIKLIGGTTIVNGSSGNYPIKADNISIGGNVEKVSIKAKADMEALSLYDFGKGRITIDDTHMITEPSDGYIASDGTNSGHIVTDEGNPAQTVVIQPVPAGMENTPNASFDKTGNKIKGLTANADYTVDGTVVKADKNGQIEVNQEWYSKTVKIIKTGSSAELNSRPQRLKIDVSVPTKIDLTIPVPIAGKAPVTSYDTGSYYYECSNIVWTSALENGQFVEGTTYSVTLTFAAKGPLVFADNTIVTFNGESITHSLSDGAKTLTVTKTFDPTESIVHVSSVSMTPDPVILTEGGLTKDVSVSVYPEDAADKSVSVTIADTNIATVADTAAENVKAVSPVAAGTTSITITANDRNVSAEVPVYVRFATPKAEQSGGYLIGLIPGRKYSVAYPGYSHPIVYEYTASDTGTILMSSYWYDKTLTITAISGSLPEECCSEPQTIKTGKEHKVPLTGLYARFSDFSDEEEVKYTYTGTAIKPEVAVYNNGHLLTPETDYTIKYSGNINVVRDKNSGEVKENSAKVTITGKGNLTGSKVLYFTIEPRPLSDPDIKTGGVTVVKDSKATPVITYKGYKLAAKDYKLTEPAKNFTEFSDMRVEGKGNFTGTIDIPVYVVLNKKEILKQTVVLKKTSIEYKPDAYDDYMMDQLKDVVKVYDTADKKKTKPLLYGTDYLIDTSDDLNSVGTKKITIVGLRSYVGSVTRSISVKPYKITADKGEIVTNADKIAVNEYVFDKKGVLVTESGSESPVLTVSYIPTGSTEPVSLIRDVDYKVTYTNNKSVSTAKKPAKYTITFIGNYKGTPAIKNNIFNIVPKKIAVSEGNPIDGLEIKTPDLIYTGKPGTYKSVPVISLNGEILAKGSYTAEYFTDDKMTEAVGKKNTVKVGEGKDSVTVFVRITAKGNYEGIICTNYKVCEKAETVYDMSKARVTIYKAKYDPATGKGKKLTSVVYTGKPIEIKDGEKENGVGEIVVEYKLNGKDYITLTKDDYTVEYVNNIDKGTATILIKGLNNTKDSRIFVGTKKTTFKIVSSNLKTFLKTFADLFAS